MDDGDLEPSPPSVTSSPRTPPHSGGPSSSSRRLSCLELALLSGPVQGADAGTFQAWDRAQCRCLLPGFVRCRLQSDHAGPCSAERPEPEQVLVLDARPSAQSLDESFLVQFMGWNTTF